jgi:peroxiredoxin
MDRLQAAGAELLACSVDAVPSLAKFAETLGGLPYPLASDWKRTVSRDYGVFNEDGGYAQRSTFVIGPDGTVVYENRAFSAGDPSHYEAVLDAAMRAASSGQ